MAKIIVFYSYIKNSGKTTTIFNMGQLLAHKKKKILIVELQFESRYFKYLELKNSNLKTQNILKHFSYYEINENLSVASLNQSFTNNNDWITEQFDKWSKSYDYILIELPWLQNDLWDKVINLSDKSICIFDSQNFTSEILMKTITAINKLKKYKPAFKYDVIILNKYIDKDHNHVNAVMQLKKIFSKEKTLNVLPFDSNLVTLTAKSLNYAIKEFWTKYAIELNEILKLL